MFVDVNNEHVFEAGTRVLLFINNHLSETAE